MCFGCQFGASTHGSRHSRLYLVFIQVFFLCMAKRKLWKFLVINVYGQLFLSPAIPLYSRPWSWTEMTHQPYTPAYVASCVKPILELSLLFICDRMAFTSTGLFLRYIGFQSAQFILNQSHFILPFGIMSRKWWICMFELDGDKNRINDTIVYANVTCCHLEWKPAPPYTNMCCCLFDCAETDGLTFQNTQRKHNALLCVISPHFYFTRN